jgi:hypothetical protein
MKNRLLKEGHERTGEDVSGARVRAEVL